jgi:hypothetical protein
MTLNWLSNASDVATIAGFVLVIGGIVIATIRRLRRNDLKHLEQGVENIQTGQQELRTDIKTLGDRFTDHITWHMGQPK